MTHLNLKLGPSSSVSLGEISNTPLNGNWWPPYAYSINRTVTVLITNTVTYSYIIVSECHL